MTVDAAQARWSAELAGWEIPADIVARAPEPPWGFPVELFRAAPNPADPNPADPNPANGAPADTPSRDRALEALPDAGSVLDVGCGGGSAGLVLAPPAASVTGVDDGEGMLASFAAAAAERGVAHREVAGTWPAIADAVEPADVVVCHHVLYNIADLAPFAQALTVKARRRVVVELTDRHPMTQSGPLWQHFHGLARPTGPTADLAADVLRESGIEPQLQRWSRPPRDVPRSAYVRLNRQRLCLTADADEEIDRIMGPTDLPREVVTIWWAGTAGCADPLRRSGA